MYIIAYFALLAVKSAASTWSEEYEGRQYYISYKYAESYKNAITACSTLDSNASLVMIKTLGVQNFLESIIVESEGSLPDCEVSTSPKDSFYIGLDFLSEDWCGYKWIDGTSVCGEGAGFIRWADHQPRLCNSLYTCVVMAGDEWYASSCNDKRPYICERSTGTTTTVSIRAAASTADDTFTSSGATSADYSGDDLVTRPEPSSTVYIIVAVAAIALLAVVVLVAVLTTQRKKTRETNEAYEWSADNQKNKQGQESRENPYEEIEEKTIGPESSVESNYMKPFQRNENLSGRVTYINQVDEKENSGSDGTYLNFKNSSQASGENNSTVADAYISMNPSTEANARKDYGNIGVSTGEAEYLSATETYLTLSDIGQPNSSSHDTCM